MRYIDLSRAVENAMPVYPGDAGVSLERVRSLAEDRYNAYFLSTGMHAGTHIDCPMHLLNSSKMISEYPLDSFAGKGCLIDARGKKTIDCGPEYDKVRSNDVVLILTGTGDAYGREAYYSEHPVMTVALARFLVSRGIRMLGIDMPSPDAPPFPVHKLLLENGIFILENLTGLEQLLSVEGDFEVFALPLKITAEASLTRAFARCLDDSLAAGGFKSDKKNDKNDR